MSDIDFEELDKAINKAVGTDSEQKPAEDVKDDNLENLDDGQETADESKKTIDLDDQGSEESDKKIVPHREGRFLDMVHPSADMSSSNSAFSPSQSITKIDPIDNDSLNEEDQKEQTSTEEDVQSSEATVESSDDGTAEKIAEQTTPAESPFIEGSEKKVSKRPLGGWSQDNQSSEKLNSEDNKDIDADNKDTEKSEEIILPPELEKELVEIEETNELRSTKNEIDESLSKKLDDELASHGDSNVNTAPDSSSEPISGLLEDGKDASEQYQVSNAKDEPSREELHPLFADGHNDHVAVSKKSAGRTTKILRWTVTIVGLVMLGIIIGASIFFFLTGGSGL